MVNGLGVGVPRVQRWRGVMGDSWFAGILNAAWLPVAAAYVFGLVSGWLIWSGARAATAPIDDEGRASGPPLLLESDAEPAVESNAADGAEKAEAKANGDPCPATMKLGAIESELRRAHDLIAAENGDDDLVEEISSLDTALRRANGRLKLLLKSVKKARPGK